MMSKVMETIRMNVLMLLVATISIAMEMLIVIMITVAINDQNHNDQVDWGRAMTGHVNIIIVMIAMAPMLT